MFPWFFLYRITQSPLCSQIVCFRGGTNFVLTLMISDIAGQKVGISSPSKSSDMSDILDLIAYPQFSIGQILFRGFAFLLFCGFYDICNQHEVTSGCCFGKIFVIYGLHILYHKALYGILKISGIIV